MILDWDISLQHLKLNKIKNSYLIICVQTWYTPLGFNHLRITDKSPYKGFCPCQIRNCFPKIIIATEIENPVVIF